MEINFNRNSVGGVGPKNRFFVFAGILILAVVLAAGTLRWWQRKNDPVLIQQAAFEKYQKQVEEAYQNDTYGGATPEETLRLFVEALKNEDIELASKYFSLDDNEKSETYLTYDKWRNALLAARDENKISRIIEIVSKAKHDSKSEIFNTASFIAYGDNDEILADIELWFNKLTKVWKIESL